MQFFIQNYEEKINFVKDFYTSNGKLVNLYQ